jgi:hypothetical protein
LATSNTKQAVNEHDMLALQKSFSVIRQHVKTPEGSEIETIDICASVVGVNFGLALASRGQDSKKLDPFETGAAVFVLHGVSKHLAATYHCDYGDLLDRSCRSIDIEQPPLKAAAVQALQALNSERDTPQVKKVEGIAADAIKLVLKNELIPGRSHLSGLWQQLTAMLRHSNQPAH